MTKKQAYELASKEFPKFNTHLLERSARAMEIFAGAFAEYVEDNWIYISLTPNKERQYASKFYGFKTGFYSTLELISEFEKIDQ